MIYALIVTTLVASGAWYWHRHAAQQTSEASLRKSDMPTHTASTVQGASGAMDADNAPVANVAPTALPSFRASDALAAAAAAAASAPTKQSTPMDARSRATNEALNQFESMTDEQRRDPAAVAKALEKLEAANGSSVVGNVDLEVLRHNLVVVGKMRELAMQLQAMQSASPGTLASQTQADLSKKLDELQSLSGELRSVLSTNKSTGASKAE
ncbi:hypothetical protein WJ39_17815 [Burkholderia diffusa]|nr:hypothetical protein WJ39_17815 [Burkholderia diffusa]